MVVRPQLHVKDIWKSKINKTIFPHSIFITLLLILNTNKAFSNSLLFEYYPAGVEESLLANTGVALEGSMGNTIYNPGALAFNNSQENLSFTGVYLNRQNSAAFEGKAKSETNISPAFTGAKYYLSDRNSLAFFIYRPAQITQKVNTDINSLIFDLNSKLDFSVFGLTYARKFSKSFSFGFTIEYTTLNIEYNIIEYSNIAAQEKLSVKEFTTNQDGVNLKLGAFYKDSKNLKFGLRITTPKFYLKSTSKLNIHEKITNSPITTSSFNSDYNSDNPFDIVVGVNYSNKDYKILTDFGYQFNSTYSSNDWNQKVEFHKRKGNPRYGAGLKLRAYNKINALFGIRFVDKRNDSSDKESLNGPSEFLYTAGAYIPEKNSHFYAGIYYKKLVQNRNNENFGTIFISVFKI